MAETDELNVEDQLNYKAETGESGEGEVFITLKQAFWSPKYPI